MACARNLKALIVFWVNGWKLCWILIAVCEIESNFKSVQFFLYILYCYSILMIPSSRLRLAMGQFSSICWYFFQAITEHLRLLTPVKIRTSGVTKWRILHVAKTTKSCETYARKHVECVKVILSNKIFIEQLKLSKNVTRFCLKAFSIRNELVSR
jgi:phage-related holin